MSDLLKTFNLELTALGHLTAAVQLGFIGGTLVFAFLNLADRFQPSKLFFVCALLGAIFNLGILLEQNSLNSLLLWRFLTGFSLAGIYPVGMKIAADYFKEGLGKSLGYLVGALVLGTAFPHLLKTFSGSEDLPWKLVIITTSVIAILGGFLILFLVPEGPYRKAGAGKVSFRIFGIFRNSRFRAAAYGYFGHMWELYTFWAFVPLILSSYNMLHPATEYNIPLISFLIIGSGGIACIAGGYISERIGSEKTAATALFLSGCCCLLFPLIFILDAPALLISFLIFWGLTVVADSPLFSTLIAQNANPEIRGTALTIVNSIGFVITIVSIQFINFLMLQFETIYMLALLAAGPAFGLWSLFRKKVRKG
ncbi:membrane protein [Salinimicrobium marinum]|uniref:Membrane protein n=2 Tax=Salinimicrobium marinum TaxID=680283 RepID=A0A918VVW3_9FLAO|nr:membrane protein [Salinimicrobium marinum]